MIQNKIENDGYAAFMCGTKKGVEFHHCAIVRVDLPIIDHVISMVARGRMNRHQPDAGHAEIRGCRIVAVVEVVQFLRETREITDSVSVSIRKGAYEDFIEGSLFRAAGGTGFGTGSRGAAFSFAKAEDPPVTDTGSDSFPDEAAGSAYFRTKRQVQTLSGRRRSFGHVPGRRRRVRCVFGRRFRHGCGYGL